MAIVITSPVTRESTCRAALALMRATAGLVYCGVRHFGRPTCIDRGTGRVRPK